MSEVGSQIPSSVLIIDFIWPSVKTVAIYRPGFYDKALNYGELSSGNIEEALLRGNS